MRGTAKTYKKEEVAKFELDGFYYPITVTKEGPTIQVGWDIYDDFEHLLKDAKLTKAMLKTAEMLIIWTGVAASGSLGKPPAGSGPRTFSIPRNVSAADDFIPTQVLTGPDDEALVKAIAATIRKASGWGKMDPVIVRIDPKTGAKYILDGHHRVEAAKREGCAVNWRKATPEELEAFGFHKPPK